jgi:hypothetical protein
MSGTQLRKLLELVQEASLLVNTCCQPGEHTHNLDTTQESSTESDALVRPYDTWPCVCMFLLYPFFFMFFSLCAGCRVAIVVSQQ